jgi:hypothetical protein
MGNKGFEAALAAVEMANLHSAVVARSAAAALKPEPGHFPPPGDSKGKSRARPAKKTNRVPLAKR